MSPHHTLRRAAVFCLAAILPTVGSVSAQGLELKLEPQASTVHSCQELVLELALTGVTSEKVTGYALFLRFSPADFRPLRFEAEEIGATVLQAGPEPFGEGFPVPCVEGAEDPWGDGAGEDVVAVLASVFAEADGTSPVTGGDNGTILLGRLVFEPTGRVTGPEGAAFSLNSEACRPPLDQTTLVFGAAGVSFEAALPEPFAVAVEDGLAITDLVCETAGDGNSVALSWQLPAGVGLEALRIVRNGELLETLPPAATSYTDETIDALGDVRSIHYAVVSVLADARDGCAVACEVTKDVPFRRGDANRDGAVNITDAVTVLRHLFQAGELTCEDAGDFDDDGMVGLNDAPYGLNFLFRQGPAIPPPFETAGVDPTEDDLGCNS